MASLFAPDALQQLLAACPSPACESCVWAIAEVGTGTELAAVKGPETEGVCGAGGQTPSACGPLYRRRVGVERVTAQQHCSILKPAVWPLGVECGKLPAAVHA